MTRSRTSSEPSPARYLPGVLGAALIVAGVGLIFWPAALITAGLLLLIVDRRLS